MALKRTIEYATSNAMFADEYGTDKELTRIADRMIRAITGSRFAKLYVPYPPNATAKLSCKDIAGAQEDTEVLYLLPSSLNTGEYDRKYVYADEDFVQKIGAIDGNIVFMDLMNFTKEQLTKLLDNADIATPDSAVEEAKRKYAEKQTRLFIEKRIKVKYKEYEQQAEAERKKLAGYSSNVIISARRVEELERLIAAYQSTPEEEQSAAKDLEELFASKYLIDLKLKDDNIVFYTTPLGITDAGGKYHPIGTFRVTINMTNNHVRIENLDNKLPSTAPKKIPHPHCNEQGGPCLGNIATVIPELTASYDVLGLWQITLSFLTSYNGGDQWGRQLAWWPSYNGDGEKESSTDLSAKTSKKVALVYCDHCKENHIKNTVHMHTCPTCGEEFCEENTGAKEQYKGEWYCSHDCVAAMQATGR